MVLDTHLSAHFQLTEFTLSSIAVRRGIPNIPDDDQVVNLRRLAMVLERVRAQLGGVPLLISSGFRNSEVNAAVGGGRTSAHLEGRAADFIAPAFGPPREICAALLKSDIAFDQLIFEGAWVHLGIAIAGEEPRRQVLTAVFQRGAPTRYLRGIV